ncbi:flippase-like domain-containing protein [Crocinitomicaceae bacterium]|nr:flippase-like domain-containing protein [Crocinitomicaceae bacterium]MDB3906788.1 flippase-like domain-containing protein [Crocinitomicaceae bacterium]
MPLGIGVYLSWYFLSGLSDEDIQQTKDAFYNANYFWIFLSLIIALAGHLSRAYRWLFLLEPLGYKPKLKNAYHAVMSGYIINYTVPRSGELARAGLLTQSENVPFEKGFATIVVERIIDVLMLGGIVLLTTVLQTNSDQFEKIMDSGGEGSSMLIWYILGAGLLMGAVGFIVYLKNQKIKSWVNAKMLGFWEGIKSVWTMKRKWEFVFHTFFIWGTYIGMMWVSALAFEETRNIPLEAVLAAFVVSAAAIALLPGGMGVYPLWVTAVLSMYDIDFAAFGIFVWVSQTLLILVLGLLSLAILQWRKK